MREEVCVGRVSLVGEKFCGGIEISDENRSVAGGGAVWSRMKFRKRTRKACDDSGGEKGDEAFRKRDVDWESEVVGGWI